MINNLNAIIGKNDKTKIEKTNILLQHIKDGDKLKYLLETDYSDIYNYYIQENADVNLIYRSHKNRNKTFFIDKPSFRTSLGSNNAHTVLMSELLPSWKKYPKRNHCIIGTTEYKSKKTYIDGDGNYNNEDREFYIILPKNGTKIAVCPSYDLWQSFKFKQLNSSDYINCLSVFDDVFFDILVFFGKKINIDKYSYIDIAKLFNNNDINNIFSIFSELENYIINNTIDIDNITNEYYDSIPAIRYFYRNIKNNESFINILDYLFNPKNNGFILINTKKTNSLTEDKELWFDSDCLFIKESLFKNILS